MSQSAFFHEGSDAVRFWVLVDDTLVGASVSQNTLRYRYGPNVIGTDPMSIFLANEADLEAAVLRRVAAGSREPVMLREFDLRVQAH